MDHWDEIIQNDSGWNADHVKSRILDAEEKLHLQSFWRRVGLTWLVVGNAVLIGATIWCALSDDPERMRLALPLGAATLLSTALSLLIAYLQYKRLRATRMYIKKLNIVRRRTQALADAATADASTGTALTNQKRYRDDVPDLVTQFREEAGRNRRVHNRYQSVIIIGSVATSAITTASVSFHQARWFAVGASAAVGLAAGFTGYFKYHERSFNSQQTADAIEREYEAVELRVGKYAGKTEEDAYAIFADAVERLRDEQNKRQQQLDQPVEVKREEAR